MCLPVSISPTTSAIVRTHAMHALMRNLHQIRSRVQSAQRQSGQARSAHHDVKAVSGFGVKMSTPNRLVGFVMDVRMHPTITTYICTYVRTASAARLHRKFSGWGSCDVPLCYRIL